MDMQIRFAETQQERDAIYRLRYQIYIQEMGYQFPSADHEHCMLTDGTSQRGRLLYAEADGEVVGTLRLQWGADAPFPPEEKFVYDLERFAPVVNPDQMIILTRFMTRADYRNSSVAMDLMKTMFAFCLDHGIQLCFLDCRPHHINLYQSLGYRPYHRSYNDPVAGLAIPLVNVVEDRAYAEQINTPFVDQLRSRRLTSEVPGKVLPLIQRYSPIHTVSATEPTSEWADLSSKLTQESGDRVSIFHGFSDDDMKRLLERSPIITCAKGDRIIHKDSGDHIIFIVLQGTVDIRVGDEVIARETAGSVVGEVAFLLHTPRTADVIAASEDVQVLGLRQKVLDDLIKSESNLAARLLYNLSRILAVKLIAGR